MKWKRRKDEVEEKERRGGGEGKRRWRRRKEEVEEVKEDQGENVDEMGGARPTTLHLVFCQQRPQIMPSHPPTQPDTQPVVPYPAVWSFGNPVGRRTMTFSLDLLWPLTQQPSQ
ncbi:hypothetical protein Pcinc_037576 [Petrolisthes cinctipes]|uniref:Uncharacterized protein n=1 Tax=Petrolisthes cinctipes TaxID=88211 RepID=A0AAE1BSG0_PETCI|nr:hypothetical protein Pcinc_037576 [Petrolisthes cinctipes]